MNMFEPSSGLASWRVVRWAVGWFATPGLCACDVEFGPRWYIILCTRRWALGSECVVRDGYLDRVQERVGGQEAR